MKQHQFLSSIAILITLLIQGCGTATIKMDTIPELKGGNPLSGIKPVTFLIKDFRDEVGDIVYSDQAPLYAVKIDRPATEIVIQAMATELKRNGHKVLESHDVDNADIFIDGIVKEYRFELHKHLINWKFSAHVKAKITVTETSGSSESITKLFSGFCHCGSLISPHVAKQRWKKCLNEALLHMIRDFSTDRDVLDVLSRVKS